MIKPKIGQSADARTAIERFSIPELFQALIAKSIRAKESLRESRHGRYAALVVSDLEKVESMYRDRVHKHIKAEGKAKNGNVKSTNS